MTLLSPWQLLWLGLLVPLVGLYILKRRREQRIVGSTLLWELALRDMRAERPWKKLIPQVSLLLQILALIIGAVALARPAGAGGSPTGSRVAVVVDCSASMAARNEHGSRIDQARAVAARIARTLDPSGHMTLIAAGPEPVVLLPLTRDIVALERATTGLFVRGTRSDLASAVHLASEGLRGAPRGSRIILVTDLSFAGTLSLGPTGTPVEVLRIGEAANNTGIVALDVRAQPTEDAPDRADIFVRVAHVGTTSVERFVTASVEGQGVIASRRLTLAPGANEAIVMTADIPPDPSSSAQFVQVQLAPDESTRATGDALALDDVAAIGSPATARLPVFIVGNASGPLERVLRSDPRVDLYTTSLALLAQRSATDPPLDGLHVYVEQVPSEPPRGDCVVVAPSGNDVWGARLGAATTSPRVITWDDAHPSLRFVSFANVHLGKARAIGGAFGRVLLTTDQGPVISEIARRDGLVTLIAFDPSESDWPTHASFVVFFRNLLERARARRAEGGIAGASVGEPLTVTTTDGEEVTATAPSGDTFSSTARGALAIVPIGSEAGIYRVSAAGKTLYAVRNLLSAEETDTSQRGRISTEDQTAVQATAPPDTPAEMWPWLAAVLLVVLVLEALWATRRVPT